MEIERIFGLLFSGFMCKLYAACFAVWLAVEACGFITATFANIGKAFGNV